MSFIIIVSNNDIGREGINSMEWMFFYANSVNLKIKIRKITKKVIRFFVFI